MSAPLRAPSATLVLSLSLAATASLATTGCRVDLGECDETAALQVVYRETDGAPMYAGQALVNQSCGGARFCHAADATERFGVPAGLDFNVAHACTPGASRTADPGRCNPEREEDDIEDIARLNRDRRNVLEWARHIAGVVERGTMPPSGAAGDEVLATSARFRVPPELGDGEALTQQVLAESELLPAVDSRDGRRILRNWLACGAPVVAAFEDPTPTSVAGRPCEGADEESTCIGRVFVEPDPPEATWPSIFQVLIEPSCGNLCHGPGALDSRDQSMLDLFDRETAYDQLVGRDAAGVDESGEAVCAGAGQLVVPGDVDASILMQKIDSDIPVDCGIAMPDEDTRYSDEFLQPIRDWIACGAPETGGCPSE